MMFENDVVASGYERYGKSARKLIINSRQITISVKSVYSLVKASETKDMCECEENTIGMEWKASPFKAN